MRRRWPWPAIAALLATTTLLACGALAVIGFGQLARHLGGAWHYPPEDAEWLLPDGAQKLLQQAYAGLDGKTIRDHQVQALSLGQRAGKHFDNRSFVNADLLSIWHPIQYLRTSAYFSAAGVTQRQHADALYLARLLRLARSLPQHHRLDLMALDQRYSKAGQPLPAATPQFVDNAYVAWLAQRYPERFAPVVSINPYRRNAVKALDDWAQRGIKTVRWLPGVQGIDPADPALKPFYKALAAHDITLLTHTGAGRDLPDANPAYGNPLRLRLALKLGVRVVMAGCGGAARYSDPQNPEAGTKPGYVWFMQLLANDDYGAHLYGSLAGLLRAPMLPAGLTRILRDPDAYEHLVYASNYPMPAVNAAVNVGALVEHGFITAAQGRALRAIYAVNPLAFDFAAKRMLRLPHTNLGLPDAVFTRDFTR